MSSAEPSQNSSICQDVFIHSCQQDDLGQGFIRKSSGIAGAEKLTSLGLLPQEKKENHAQLEITSFVLELAMK